MALAIGDPEGGAQAEIGGISGAVISSFSQLPGGLLAWSYPAAVMTVPGVLLIIAVLAQAGGALAWLPVVRRNLGGDRRRRDRKEQRPLDVP